MDNYRRGVFDAYAGASCPVLIQPFVILQIGISQLLCLVLGQDGNVVVN